MNPSGDGRDESSSEGESSRNPVDSSDSKSDLCASTSRDSPQDSMKRAAAKRLIERYFYQLVDGCGNPQCDNKDCASSGETRNLTPNEAAAEAIKLFYKDAKLCDRQNCLPTKVARTTTSSASLSEPCHSEMETSPVAMKEQSEPEEIIPTTMDGSCHLEQPHTVASTSKLLSFPNNNLLAPLTEERLCELCEECASTNKPESLSRVLGETLGQPSVLARSFAVKPSPSSIKENTLNSQKELRGTSSTGDPDKDVDSVTGPGVDLQACRRAFQRLSCLSPNYYNPIILNGLAMLSENLKVELRIRKYLSLDDVVNCFLIAFETPIYNSIDTMDMALIMLCEAAANLPVKGQAKLARIWALHCKESLSNILVCLHSIITLRVVSTDYDYGLYMQDDNSVVAATKLMRIVYYASILAGTVEKNARREDPVVLPSDPLGDAFEHIYPTKHFKQRHQDDPLALELRVNVLDCRKPFLPFEDFYNEPLCDHIEMDRDFSMYKSVISGLIKPFAFLHYPFILTAATKSLGLYYDNRIRMYSERRASMLQAVIGSTLTAPYLRLKVRRTHIIEDALVELEMIAMERAMDLKKQLVVEFEGEQGVDEGGVSKEFFQLIVEEIFNPDYGMFTHQTDSHTVWFNPTSFETEAQFTLIGIVLGLAIYNNVILAVNFPMVLYRKLLGRKGSFHDLADWNPVLYSSLKQLLEYSEPDIVSVFEQTFRICYQDMFGNPLFHELKPHGDSVNVDQHNKQEFVDLYADFLLNKSVESQFGAFRRGFAMVTDESPLAALFRPEELETLVCGSKNFDFNELERTTEYEGGYTADSPIIRDFWSIAHGLSLADKRRLLQFTTGSDRVPVGGLSHLKLVIARNGPDSDRLPTAHTCFNVLLLPEYEGREKLNDRLVKAISYSKGFGML